MATESALVVLHPGSDPSMSGTRAAEVPTDAADAARVVEWFRGQGFETGPVVGTSFAISGDAELFRDVLGGAAPDAGGEAAFATDALEQSVSGLVAAIVVQAPPDFGPGNP